MTHRKPKTPIIIIANITSCMDMDKEFPRERTNILSVDISRELSIYSSILSIPYMERMEISKLRFILDWLD